jgi:hypothetical protein
LWFTSGKAIDRLGDQRKLLRRQGHRGQRAGANALGCEDGADARDLPLAAQRLEHPQDGAFGDPEARRQLGEGCRTQREIPLELVEQAKVERRVHHRHQKPVRLARLVKKMPLGACTGNSPTWSKVAVS